MNKIALPYIETVGVGEHSRTVIITTREEMLDFLRSDDALMVYSNTQELLALSNIYNININIFSYGESGNRWTEICPDPLLVAESEERLGKWVPDMVLYHSSGVHYDLLVKDDSRLALLGLMAGSVAPNEGAEVSDENPDKKWMHVKNANKKRNNSKKDTCNENKNEEKLLEETEDNNAASKDLEDELTLVGSKNDGFRRTGPQEKPECADKKDKVHKCSECLFEFLSDGLLEAHKKTHKMNKSCEICSKFFNDIKSIEEHMKTEHIEKHTTSEWNCDDCAFQANCASELMKLLKITGHQPSKDISDKRKVFNDYKQCFTCKMDFDGYFNLMNHRKVVHPSNKSCRNFLSGACKFEDECWYVHDKKDVSQNAFENFKCDQCETDFKGRLNFMRNKKTSHSQSIPSCEKFNLNKCYRSDQECWFEHKTNKSKNDANS